MNGFPRISAARASPVWPGIALGAALAIGVALVPSAAAAADIRTGDTIVVGSGETIDDDLYAFGSTVSILGTVTGDVIAAGSNVSIGGTVGGDVAAAGSGVSITGTVGGNVRAAGATVTIAGPVQRDALLAGNTVSLAPPARIGRDLLAGGQSIAITSPIGRDVNAAANALTIGASVGRNVSAETDRLTIDQNGAIAGDLTYYSPYSAMMAPGASVAGESMRLEPRVVRDRPTATAQAVGNGLDWLRTLVGVAAFGVLLILVAPRFSRRAAEAETHSVWASLGLGLGALFAAPIVALIVFAIGLAVGGWWLGIIGLMLYVVALPIGYVLSSFVVGRWLAALVGRTDLHPVWQMLVGVLTMALIAAIPVVGPFVAVVMIVFGLGALTLALLRGEAPARASAAAGA